MSTIVLARTRAQYDAINHFVCDLHAAFAGMGYEIITLEAGPTDAQPEVMRRMREVPLAFLFSFNGCRCDLFMEGQAAGDLMRAPTVSAMVDPPFHHRERLLMPIVHHLTTWVDHTHIPFVRRHFPNVDGAEFLPHCGFVADVPLDGIRDIPVMMAGSFGDPQGSLDHVASIGPTAHAVAIDTVNRSLAHPEVPILDHFFAALKERKAPVDEQLSETGMTILFAVETSLRLRRRLDVLRALGEEGVVVDCYGNGLDKCSAAQAHRCHGPVPFAETLRLMARAQVLLNVSPLFPNGSHERVLSGMANATTVVTDRNPFWITEFTEGEDFIGYDFRRLRAMARELKAVLADAPRRQRIGASAMEKTRRFDSLHAARRIIDLVDAYKQERPERSWAVMPGMRPMKDGGSP